MLKLFICIAACFIFVHSLPIYAQSLGTCDATSYNDYPAISNIERNVFNTTFRNENIYKRLNRLESEIFGSTFTQESLYNRLERIKQAVASEYSDSQPIYNSSSGITNIMGLGGSYNNNDSYSNQYSCNSIWDIIGLLLNSQLSGSNYPGNYNYSNYPDLQRELNLYQNSQFGTGARILPY